MARLASLETNSSNVAAYNLAWPQCWNFEGKDELWVDFFYLIFSEFRKLGVILDNEVFQKLKLSRNASNKKDSPKMIFWN